MTKIENFQFKIQEAFGQNFYVVPDYQREYVWTEREVNQLLEDIDEQVDDRTDHLYFIGMVLVTSVSNGNYEVIDGQQRLTTLFLLLCALRYRFGEASAHFPIIGNLLTSTYISGSGDVVTNLRLDPRYEHAEEVTSRLVTGTLDGTALRNELKAAHVPFTGSVERLTVAYDAILRFLEAGYDTTEELKKYWGFVAGKVVFIQISTDMSSALKIFETINERGVGLSPMDLLKNLLFSNVKPSAFAELKASWKKVTGPLEKSKEKPLRFLRYFLMANYTIGRDVPDGVIREDEIYDWLTRKDNATQVNYAEKPFAFVAKLAHSVELYVGFQKGRGNDGEASPSIARLQMMTGGAFSLHYILLLAAAPLPAPAFEVFVQKLEDFLFYYIFTKTPTKELERSFGSWADELRDISAMPPGSDQDEALANFTESHFGRGIAAKRRELSDALARYSVGSMQRYRTVYLLARIAERVDRAYNGSSFKGVQDLTPYKNLEIEHILPEQPSSSDRETWAAENPDCNYDDFKLRLGNLTLLEKPLNIIASNGHYSQKLAQYAQSSHYMTRSLGNLEQVGVNTSITAINKHLSAYATWGADEIESRQLLLAGLVDEIWGDAIPKV